MTSSAATLIKNWLPMGAIPYLYRPTEKIPAETAISSLSKGTICFSADFELAWAWRFGQGGIADALEKARLERGNVPRLIQIFEDHEIPITWATVGHLFLESCTHSNGRAHAELARPAPFKNAWWTFSDGDWYQHDPCSDVSKDPEWYAPDLIERILKSRIPHEMGCHSFSHPDFGEKYGSAELVTSELQACAEAMARLGLKAKSFVFPGNISGHFEQLERAGYQVVRASSVGNPDLSLPVRMTNGLLGIQVGLDMNSSGWGSAYYLKRLIHLVRTAADRRLLCSIWFHPSLSPADIEEVMVPLLKECARLRERGRLDVRTMGELANLAAQ